MFDSLTKTFLIAMPNLQSRTFENAIIIIYENKKDIIKGLMINKPLKHKVKDLFKELKINSKETEKQILDKNIYIGGPINIQNIFIVYKKPYHIHYNNIIEINNELIISNNINILKDISKNITPNEYMILAGCTSWTSNQLLDEIKENNWFTSNINNNIIFSKEDYLKWEKIFYLQGFKKISQLNSGVGHA